MSKRRSSGSRRGRGDDLERPGDTATRGDSRPIEDRFPPFVVVGGPPVDGSYEHVWLQCPRSGCGGEFVVNREDFKRGGPNVNVETRPCPYCFRASTIPKAVPVTT